MNKFDLSIVVPLYNEEKNVKDVADSIVKNLSKSKINYELILVNNGSVDSTPKIIEQLTKRNKRIRKVDVIKNQGYGWGIINGLNVSKGKYLGYIDGDGQFDSENIIKAYTKMKKNNLDFCKGRRLVREDVIKRNIASLLYNLLLNLMFVVNINDVNAKPKLMSMKCYNDLNLKSKDWFIDTEIMIKVKKKNYKYGEIPLEFKKRKAGRSNVKLKIISEFLKNLLYFRIKGI